MFSSAGKNRCNDAISTILGEGVQLTGDMRFGGTARIDGEFDGNVSGDHLIISPSGKVLGDVVARSCVCYGHIDGHISVESLQVKQGGYINGTIVTDNLEVESGSTINGEIKPRQQQSVPLLEEDDGAAGKV